MVTLPPRMSTPHHIFRLDCAVWDTDLSLGGEGIGWVFHGAMTSSQGNPPQPFYLLTIWASRLATRGPFYQQ